MEAPRGSWAAAILLFLLCGSFAPAAPDASPFARVDAQVDALEKEIVDLEGRYAVVEREFPPSLVAQLSAEGGKGCQDRATPDYVVRHAGLLERCDPVRWATVLDNSLEFFECEDLTVGGEPSCRPLVGLNFPGVARRHLPDAAAECSFEAGQMRFYEALIKGSSDSVSICISHYNGPLSGSPSAICETIARDWRDPEKVCGEEERFGSRGDNVRGCLAWWKGVGGDAAACSGVPNGFTRNECVTLARFSRASRLRRASACDSDALCLAMLEPGEGYCGRLARAVTRSYCALSRGQGGRDNALGRLRLPSRRLSSDFQAAASKVLRALAGVDQRMDPGERSLATQIDARYERLARLDFRREKLAREVIDAPFDLESSKQ